MSQSDGVSSVLKWGLLAGGAYFLYQTFMAPSSSTASAASAPAPAVSASTGSISLSDLQTALANTPPALVPAAPPAASPDTVKSLILSQSAGDPAISSDGKASIHVWNTYRNLVATPLTPAQFTTAFPGDPGQLTLDDFLAQIKTSTGISGLGAVSLSVPVVVKTGDGRRVVVFAARDLSGAGPRVAPFVHRHPFRVGVPLLPSVNWQRQS